jgi:hypothetical protein
MGETMPQERATIDEALNRAFWMVKLPSMVLLAGPLLAAYFAMQRGWIPSHGLARLAPFLFISFAGGWLAWSVQVPKWRLWAYERVDDIQALKHAAVEDKIIWPDRSLFARTEIAGAAVWARIRQVEAEQLSRHGDA